MAAQCRRTANATYFASHGVDQSNALNYGVDMTPLITTDLNVSPFEFIEGYIDSFKRDVRERIDRLTK